MNKSNSKKIGIKLKVNKDDRLFIFDNRSFDGKTNHLLLVDNKESLKELENNTNLKYVDYNSNLIFGINKNNMYSIFENKYTIDKNNIINKKLLMRYCDTDNVPTNLIIQIIHNNEDLKKILSLYINDVIYSLSAINEKIDRECISTISDKFIIKNEKIITRKGDYNKNDLNDLLDTLKRKNFIYGFSNTKKESIFEYLKVISLLRNKISHDVKDDYDSIILKNELNNYMKIKGKNFLKNSKLNIDLICQLYSDNKDEEVREYYKYYINEENKSLGLSIKNIMAIARDKYPSNLDEEVNKKYNMLLRYHLYRYLKSNQKMKDRYISMLRESDFEDKDIIYEKLTDELKDEFFKVKNACRNINFKSKHYINNETIKNILEKKENWCSLSIQVYALSKFLTIKETNELISSVINKLQSINDLLLASSKIDVDLNKYIKNRCVLDC